MKKVLALAVITAALFAIACKNKEGDNSNPSINGAATTSAKSIPSGTYAEESNRWTYTFSGNNVTWTLNGREIGKATYEIEGDVLVMTGENGQSSRNKFSLEGNTLMINMGAAIGDIKFTRQ